MRLLDIIAGALAFGLMGIEIFGFAAAWTVNLKLVKSYSFLAWIAAAVALGIQVIEILEHFVTKGDQINQCISNNQSIDNPGTLIGGNGFASTDITDACNSDWSRYTWYTFAWLIVTLLWAGITTAIAVAYWHQVSNPANSRSMAPSAAYTMNSYPQGQDPPFVPPPLYYGGANGELPEYHGDSKMPEINEKGGFPDEERGFDIEHNGAGGDLANHYSQGNYSEVTLRGREDEGRV